ncbi:MAG: PQQ-binding-like beta-propeller repeat protein [Anaerolineae bacterium]|nr:PQQ-binding-like beta-propeller repeat protein [Anaerolineae bacterium]
MKVRWKLAILLLSITIMTGCSDATEETPTAATITPTAVATVPPSPVPEASPSLVMPSATPTPTAHATGGAFVSVLPTPTWTPTPTPSPTPWPTLTPLPAVPAATPELASLPDFGIAWIRPAGNWSNYRGRQLNPTVLQQDWLLITSTGWRQPVDALSISDGATVWRYPADLEPGSPDIEIRSIAARDDILAVQAMKKLVVLTPTSGTPGWSVDLQDRVDLAGASDGQLYLFDYSVYPAQLVALDARTSQERWRYDCTFSSPVLATDEWLFVTCEDSANLLAIAQIAAETGILTRLQPVPSQMLDILGYQEGVLLLGTAAYGQSPYDMPSNRAYQVTALDWAAGQPLWQAYTKEASAVKFDGDSVLVASGDQLQRRSLRDGKSLWVTTLPVSDHVMQVAQAVNEGDTLLVGSNSGFLYAFDRLTGSLLWMQDMWGMGGSPWRPVRPLGVDGDTIVVWMSTAEGDAVAGLRRGIAFAPWPTPTFSSDSVFESLMATATPPSSKTAVPTNWTPEPVEWIPSHWYEFSAADQEMEDQLLTWLSLHPGDYQGFNQQVSQWPAIEDPEADALVPYPTDYVTWVQSVDLDGDGQNEDIIAYGLRQKAWAIIAHDVATPHLVHRDLPSHNDLAVDFVRADDINCDGQVELVIETSASTTQGDYLSTVFGQWDGTLWTDLGTVTSNGLFSQKNQEPRIDFEDITGDGCLEVLARQYPMHVSPTRPYTQIVAFQDGSYQPVERRSDPSRLGYYKVIDANRALAHSDLDGALELATQALKDPETGMSSQGGLIDVGRYEARIAAYAAAEAMLVHALRGERDAMQPLLEQVENAYDRPDNPYLPAARALWETYVDTGDALAACHAMEQVVRLWGDAELVRFGSEQLTIEQICPLD